MGKHIKAISKQLFEDNFTNESFKNYDSACFISILDMDNDEQKYDKTINNFLQVKMWDVETDVKDADGVIYNKPSDTELKKIVDFVNKHKDKIGFIIHCSAGVSRSGAVATFIYDKFLSEIDKDKFRYENKHIMPNIYILNRLKELDANSQKRHFYEIEGDEESSEELNNYLIDTFKDYFKNLK